MHSKGIGNLYISVMQTWRYLQLLLVTSFLRISNSTAWVTFHILLSIFASFWVVKTCYFG